MASRRGVFVVLEGPDKSGKSTQAALLARHLKSRRAPFLHTREPGGTPFAEQIRNILLDPKHKVEPVAELLLYEAARAQHTHETLLPALRAGKIIICERYTLATLVYQGWARGLPLPLIRTLNRVATGGLRPDLTFVLDIPDSQFRLRKRARHDRLELESAQFRRRVRDGYRRLAAKERAVLLDGGRPVSDIHREIVRRLERAL